MEFKLRGLLSHVPEGGGRTRPGSWVLYMGWGEAQVYGQGSKVGRERGGYKGIGPQGLKTFLDSKLYRKLDSLLKWLPGPGCPPPRMLPLLLSPPTPAQVI